MGGPGCYAPKAGGGAPTTSHELVVNDLGRGLRLTSSGDRGTPSQLAWGEDGTQRGDHRDRGRPGGRLPVPPALPFPPLPLPRPPYLAGPDVPSGQGLQPVRGSGPG